MLTAKEIIAHLGLSPLPREGGYFRVNYLSNDVLPAKSLPERYRSDHNAGNAIYFLTTPVQFSAMHTLITDENYYFHYGDPLEMLLLYPDGSGEVKVLGCDLASGQRPQIGVPRDTCHGSRPMPGGKFGFSLLSTSMAPGYSDGDVSFAEGQSLLASYPDFAHYISGLTRDKPINI